MVGGIELFPEQASSYAGQVDLLYLTLIGLSALFTIPIVLLIVYFAVRYRRGAVVDRSGRPPTKFNLEYAWIAGLLLLSLPVFVWGARLYFRMSRPPSDALEINVVGQQWMWQFQHPGGQREINQLHVPVGRPVRLLMTSQDVIHSFFVPAFRTKMDVLPGRYTTLWFQATRTGEFHLFCAEYCGAQHADMIGQVVVMEPAEYEAWLSGRTAGETPVALGQSLFQQLGCAGCHRPDGSGPGPSLAGVFGQPVALEDGTAVVADENYIRESILMPNAKIVAGYPSIMPSYEGQVSEEELTALIAYVESLGQGPATGEEQP